MRLARLAYSTYIENKKLDTDIKDHLEYLYMVSSGGKILELGTRRGVSTSALLAGVELSENGHLWSVDIDPSCADVFRNHPQWTFVNCDSLNVEAIEKAGLPEKLDLVFIDTEHNPEPVWSELMTWVPRVYVGGKIILHDTETFIPYRDTIRKFCDTYKVRHEMRYGSNGLTILYVDREITV